MSPNHLHDDKPEDRRTKKERRRVSTSLRIRQDDESTGDSQARSDDSSVALTMVNMDDLRQRLAFLCHDLQCFSSNSTIADRLASSVYPFLIGPPYMTAEDAQLLLSSDLTALRPPLYDDASSLNSGGSGRPRKQTLTKFLEKGMADLMAARRAKGEDTTAPKDFVMCTSHDLAPLLIEACAFPKQLFETRSFKNAYKRWEKALRKTGKKGQKGVERVATTSVH